ncbi:hypothetical protein QJS10_CPB18g00664 [Acorus calamus]|uniref:Uncharacterized protein n=1 Tax=Acorus calamus TaxID=4465 RepID=A0AAV9CLM1_ACOCL|nr:hypothetical protein QJS10_CPB18g00664 [Acorus calamus]
MDEVLCDELLQTIFLLLPPSSTPSITLVSRRWLNLHRSITSSLILPHPPPHPLPHLLSRYPSLTSLTLLLSSPHSLPTLLSLIILSSPNLLHLRLLSSPLSSPIPSPLLPSLTSLSLSLFSPPSFLFLLSLPNLKVLSVDLVVPSSSQPNIVPVSDSPTADLPLESLTLSGILPGHSNLSWLWCGCRHNLRRLRLKSCEGTGDEDDDESFADCLQRLRDLELRSCRSIADRVLLLAADRCRSLSSLLVYDGGSRDGLRRFIARCGPSLRALDLRLPLDLDNGHLSAAAERFRGRLVSLRLQSCCLVTGEGLKSLAEAVGAVLEELVLVNCDVVEREPGLLTSLGQSFQRLKRLDLSYNEFLLDKEVMSMVVSCKGLVEIRLRGCGGLTDASVVSVLKHCLLLEKADFMQCCKISSEAVGLLIENSPRLGRVFVEEGKVSEAVRVRASRRGVQIN